MGSSGHHETDPLMFASGAPDCYRIARPDTGKGMAPYSFNVFVTNTADGTRQFVALASPTAAFTGGLRAEAIVGELTSPLGSEQPISPDSFVANSVFRAFLSDVIARNGPDDPGMQAEATRLGQGYIAVIDGRTPTPEGPVPPEDIIGVFGVSDGKVVPGSYQPSPNHRLLSKHGFFQLSPFLGERLQQQLEAQPGTPQSRSDPGWV